MQSGVSMFWAEKYASEANKYWDKFYKRNQTNFYRDRHWTADERTDGFSCLAQQHVPPAVLVEAGCGVGNSVWPLLTLNDSIRIQAFDFAPKAIELIHLRKEYLEGRINAFVWDFCRTSLDSVEPEQRDGLSNGGADFVTLIFVLSAVPPQLQQAGVSHLCRLLKPGGRLLFRDYATGDLAQTRFKSRNRIESNYFVRQDSTLSYFFDENRLTHLMSQAGLVPLYVRRVHRVIENRKETVKMERVFLQGEFQKC